MILGLSPSDKSSAWCFCFWVCFLVSFFFLSSLSSVRGSTDISLTWKGPRVCNGFLRGADESCVWTEQSLGSREGAKLPFHFYFL